MAFDPKQLPNVVCNLRRGGDHIVRIICLHNIHMYYVDYYSQSYSRISTINDINR